MVRTVCSLQKNGNNDFTFHNLGQIPRINCTKAILVGMKLSYSMDTTILDTVGYFLDNQIIKPSFSAATDESTTTSTTEGSNEEQQRETICTIS